MELIIFDVDGTLVHSDKRDSQTFADTYERIYRRPFPSIDWRLFPHVTDNIIFGTVIQQHFQRSPSVEETTTFQDVYMEALRQAREQEPAHFQEVPGARQAIEQLQEVDCLIGIGTGGWKIPAHIKLSHVGITIEDRLFSGGDGKPTREAILEETIAAAEVLNGGPLSRVVYLGDAEWDVTTTRNMQIDFVGVRRAGDLDTLWSLGAETVIQDYTNYGTFEAALKAARPPKK
ncbi:MAG: HAD hydrolase-like protein [Phaeodactylibacter sp.]|uniref:HAD family hydrolase n=1 Tax=Phaeodactylibacter sp. TaxID=1940289 RepID=UPI0032EFF67F